MDKKEKQYSLWNNYIASFILAICFVSLIVMFVVNQYQHHSYVETKQKVYIVLSPRGKTISTDDNIFKVVDSLNYVIQNYERMLESKYKYVIDQKEKDDYLLSAASIVIGIIVSILGFFGFKNFQSIEEKAKNIAEEKAEEYLKDNMKFSLSKVVDETYLVQIKDTVTKSIEDGIVKKLNNELDKLGQFEKTSNNIGEQLKIIQYRLDRIERAWESKFNESFNTGDLGEQEAGAKKPESENENPFES